MAIPLITIGITCHNAGGTIERAVESALSQDWKNFEVIIVDDCSSDNSPLILQRISDAHSNVSVIRHSKNKGYPAALNSIVAAARGEFVSFFDDDDESACDRLTAQYRRICRYEHDSGAELVFCYANRNVVQPGETLPDHVALALGRRAPEPRGAAVADYLFALSADPKYVWGMFGSCTLMARRSTFQTIGRFDEKFRRSAEWDMAVRGAFKGGHFIAVDRPLITQYKTSSADKSGTTPLKYSLLLREKYRRYLSAKRAYLASRALARSNFYGNKRAMMRSYSYRIMAYALVPRLLWERLSA